MLGWSGRVFTLVNHEKYYVGINTMGVMKNKKLDCSVMKIGAAYVSLAVLPSALFI